MAEDLISSYIDRTGVASDTEFILNELNKIMKGLKSINDFKVNINTGETFRKVSEGADKAKVSTEELNKSQVALQNNFSKGLNIAAYGDLISKSKQGAEAFGEQKAALDKLGNSLDDNIKRQQIYKDRLAAVKEDLNKLQQFKGLGGKEVEAEMAKLTKQALELKQANSDVTKTITTQIKENRAASGSMEELSQRLQLLKRQRVELTDADRESPFGQQLLKDINSLDQEIKELDAQQGQYFRNVGNYQGSAKIIVGALKDVEKEIDKLKDKQKGLQDLRNVTGFKRNDERAAELNKVNIELDEATKKFNVLNQVIQQPGFVTLAARVGDANAEFRQFSKTLIDLEANGQGSTDFATELRTRLAGLQDTISDTRAEIKAMASDTRGFDLFASSVGTMASTFQTAASASELFGEASEDVQKSIQKLVAIQNISNGVRQIATDLTTKGSAANKAFAFVQAQVAIVTNVTTSAVNRFKAALALSGIGLAVIALGFIADKMGLFGSSTEETTGDLDAFNAALEQGNLGLDRRIERLERNIELEKIAARKRGSTEEELTAITLKGLDDIYKEKLKSADLADDAFKELVRQGEQSVVLFKTIGENGNKMFEVEGIKQGLGSLVQADNAVRKLDEAIRSTDSEPLIKTLTGIRDAAVKVQSAFQVADVAKNNLVKATGEDEAKDAEEARKKQESLDKEASERRKRNAEKDRKAQYEIQKLIIQDKIDLQKAFSESDAPSQPLKIDSRMQQMEEERNLALLDKAFQLSNEDLTGKERELIVLNYSRRIRQIETNTANDIMQIRRSINDDLQAQAESDSQALTDGDQSRIDTIAKFYQKEQEGIERLKNQKITALNDEFSKGVIAKEEYEERKLVIENQALENSLKSQIAYYKQVITLYGKDEDAKATALNAIAALEAQLSGIAVQGTVTAADKAIENADKIKEAYKNLASELEGLFFDMFTNGIEREKNAIQEKLDLLESTKQKDIEVANQSILSSEDRANAIAVIEARAAAQREQLERRKRQLNEQQAKFQRAQTIANIIQSTAEAVVSTLGAKPWTPANIALAAVVGTIGAVQLVRALATPIPKYEEGTMNHPGGLAIVGDGGVSEYAVTPDGSIHKTPATDTLVDLPKGTKVLPSEKDFHDYLYKSALNKTFAITQAKPKEDNRELAELRKMNKGLKGIKEGLKQAPEKKPSVRDYWKFQDSLKQAKWQSDNL